MNDNIEIIEKEIGDVVEIEENIPMWKMPSVLGKDFQKILDYLNSQNMQGTQPPYTRYVNVDWNAEISKSKFMVFLEVFTRKWHLRAGMPTPRKLTGQADLIPFTIEKTRYVRSLHKGPYPKVGNTYKKMVKWATENKVSIKNESIEFYLNDPRDTPKENLETEVLIPLE